MRVYTHLTLSEREYPEKKWKEGKSFHQIAAALGRTPSTIGSRVGHQECRIRPDRLLFYQIKDDGLARTGSHSDLFGK